MTLNVVEQGTAVDGISLSSADVQPHPLPLPLIRVWQETTSSLWPRGKKKRKKRKKRKKMMERE